MSHPSSGAQLSKLENSPKSRRSGVHSLIVHDDSDSNQSAFVPPNWFGFELSKVAPSIASIFKPEPEEKGERIAQMNFPLLHGVGAQWPDDPINRIPVNWMLLGQTDSLDSSRLISNGFSASGEASKGLVRRYRRAGEPHDKVDEVICQQAFNLESVPSVELQTTAAGVSDISTQSDHGTYSDEKSSITSLKNRPPGPSSTAAWIACPVHPNQPLQLCPRECSWHLEQSREHLAGTSNIDLSHLPPPDHTTVEDTSTTPSLSHSPRIFQTQNPVHHRPISIKNCHILIVLGFVTILGSLVGALWRAEALDDASGGFALGQYCLEAGALVVGCFTAVHVKYCRCWETGERVRL